MKLIKPLLVLALIFGHLGPTLFFVECALAGSAAHTQALPIALLAAVFFAYGMGAIALLNHLSEQGSKAATGFLLLNNVLRFLIAIFALVVYGIVVRENFLLFTANLFVFYLAVTIYISTYSIRLEHKNNNKEK